MLAIEVLQLSYFFGQLEVGAYMMSRTTADFAIGSCHCLFVRIVKIRPNLLSADLFHAVLDSNSNVQGSEGADGAVPTCLFYGSLASKASRRAASAPRHNLAD